LRASFTAGADTAFLQKYAGIPLPIRPRCEARRAQESSKSNSSRDIPIYPTTNSPKSQKALPLFRKIITFLYNVVIIWVSTTEISRSVRALKRKNSLLRAVHRQNRRAPKEEAGKRLSLLRQMDAASILPQSCHVRLTLRAANR
jgi:hypothetical protein